MILPTYKGLYILTAKALEPYGEIKFGMSMRLQYRWHDYEMLKKNTIGYHKVYHLSERYKSSNVKWIESIILDRTKEFASELFNTEFRKMSWEDLDKIILDTLKEYNCDYLEDTELEKKIPEITKVGKDCDHLEPVKPEITKRINIDKHIHQVEANKKLIEHYKTNDKAMIVWACGGGKTIIAIYQIINYDFKKVVIGVPSELLLEQWQENLSMYTTHKIMIVGGKGTTDRGEIELFVRENEYAIVITTYHSSHCLLNISFDFKIADECHHLCFKTDNESNAKSFKMFHDIEAKKMLSLTATLKDIDENGFISNMDEPTFGKVVDNRSVAWMIDNKYITDYNVIIPKIDIDNLYDQFERFILTIRGVLEKKEKEKIEDGKDIPKKNYEKIACQLIASSFLTLQSIVRGHMDHVLMYCNDTFHAELITDIINSLIREGYFRFEDIFIGHMVSNMSKSKRDSIKTEFNLHQVSIIPCVYICGEGYDNPKINGVVFTENMISIVRIVQSGLRGDRLDIDNPDKVAKIVIPCVVGDDFEDDKSSDFDNVRRTIAKMATVDENLIHRIKSSEEIKSTKKYINNTYRGEINFDDDADFTNKMKIRLLKRKCLSGNLYKFEFNTLKVKIKNLNISSPGEYVSILKDDECYIENPDKYFSINGDLWKGWYEFLSIDKVQFPKTIEEYKQKCKDFGFVDELHREFSQDVFYNSCKEKNLPFFDKEGSMNELYPSWTDLFQEFPASTERRC